MATKYVFRIRACSQWTQKCGNWSTDVISETMAGPPSEPRNLRMECEYDHYLRAWSIKANWSEPETPNGKIESYDSILEETPLTAPNTFFRRTASPVKYTKNSNSLKVVFENLHFNSNYTLKVSARTRQNGNPARASCSTPRSTPPILDYNWNKKPSNSPTAHMRLIMPQISERNGPICGYRIYVYRMPTSSEEMPSVQGIYKLPIKSYEDVHNANNTKGGVYIAEVIPNELHDRIVILGDEINIFDTPFLRDRVFTRNTECRKMMGGHLFGKDHIERKFFYSILEMFPFLIK